MTRQENSMKRINYAERKSSSRQAPCYEISLVLIGAPKIGGSSDGEDARKETYWASGLKTEESMNAREF